MSTLSQPIPKFGNFWSIFYFERAHCLVNKKVKAGHYDKILVSYDKILVGLRRFARQLRQNPS